jgi:hypothetical protein
MLIIYQLYTIYLGIRIQDSRQHGHLSSCEDYRLQEEYCSW